MQHHDPLQPLVEQPALRAGAQPVVSSAVVAADWPAPQRVADAPGASAPR